MLRIGNFEENIELSHIYLAVKHTILEINHFLRSVFKICFFFKSIFLNSIFRFLKDQLQELLSNSTTEGDKIENSGSCKNWIYTLELCEHMYNQGLLDRQEFLQWVLEMVEKCKYPDDPAMRLVRKDFLKRFLHSFNFKIVEM